MNIALYFLVVLGCAGIITAAIASTIYLIKRSQEKKELRRKTTQERALTLRYDTARQVSIAFVALENLQLKHDSSSPFIKELEATFISASKKLSRATIDPQDKDLTLDQYIKSVEESGEIADILEKFYRMIKTNSELVSSE